ncbi:MAG: ribose transport system substrate-binding protein [Nocardioides sp.]|jgi:simple sugar transport system substrate-binding protein|nr:ribose transport system substrate-binding protein [Nocardioides sp.]
MRKFGLGQKQVLFIAAAVLAGASLSACTSSADEKNKDSSSSDKSSSSADTGAAADVNDLTVGLISHNIASPGIKLYRDTFTKLAEDRGWTVKSVDTAGDVVAAVNQTKQWVDEGVDVIVNDTVPNDLMSDGIAAAGDAGIPWFSVSAGGGVDGVTNEAEANEYASGSQLGLAMVDKMGGKGNILRLTWSGLQSIRERAAALDAIVATRPDVKIVDTIELKVPGWADDAYKQVTNYLQTHDDVDAIWMPWDDFAVDVSRAVKESGQDNIFIGGFDLDDSAADALRSGGAFQMTNALNIPAMASLQVDLIAQQVSGTDVPAISYVPNCLATPDNIPAQGGRDSAAFWTACYEAPLKLVAGS